MPTYDFDVTEVEYLRHGDKGYPARFYRPKGAGPFPAVFVPFYEPETSTGQNDKKLRAFAYDLTKRGFVTLSIGTLRDDGSGD